MLLNPSILYEELSKQYSFVSFTGFPLLSKYLKPPLLFMPGMTPEPNTAYVGRAQDFSSEPVFPDSCCLISAGSLDHAGFFPNTPTIMIRDADSVYELYNTVQRIYEKYMTWNSQVFQLVLNDAEIQTILNASSSIFPNTFFLVLDQNYHVIATTAKREVVMDETGSTPSSVLSRFKKDPEYVNSRFRKGTFLYEGKFFDHKILLHHLFINGELRGTFSLAENGAPFSDSTRALFDHLSEYIEYCFSHRSHAAAHSSNLPKEIIDTMLTGELPSDKALSEALEIMKWDPTDSYKVCFIPIREADKLIGSTLYLCRKFDAQFASSFSLEYNGDIVILLNTSKIGYKEEQSKAALSELLSQNILAGGVSMGFSNLTLLRNYYIQARAAYLLGSKKYDGPIYYFSDIRLDYMLHQIATEIYPETLCPEALLKLLENDRTKGTQYIKTLDTYFQSGMNASQTAKLLFINRSTLLERLDKIWTRLELNPNDHDSRMYLILCLKILGI